MSNSKLPEYSWHPKFDITDEVKRSFEEHGYLIIRGLLTKEETAKLLQAVEEDQVENKAFTRPDGEGGQAMQCQWYQLYDDITGAICRSNKIAGAFEKLLGGEVYPYQMKFTLKNPFTGGAWVWHQDYGFVDTFTKSIGNGSMVQILDGSHKAGRIEHIAQGGQVGADMKRVKQLMTRFPLIEAEMSPGDGLMDLYSMETCFTDLIKTRGIRGRQKEIARDTNRASSWLLMHA